MIDKLIDGVKRNEEFLLSLIGCFLVFDLGGYTVSVLHLARDGIRDCMGHFMGDIAYAILMVVNIFSVYVFAVLCASIGCAKSPEDHIKPHQYPLFLLICWLTAIATTAFLVYIK